MSEDLFTKAMAKAYELHPCAQASSNFCWYLFKAGSETKDSEIKRLSRAIAAMARGIDAVQLDTCTQRDWDLLNETAREATKDANSTQ